MNHKTELLRGLWVRCPLPYLSRNMNKVAVLTASILFAFVGCGVNQKQGMHGDET